MNIFKQIKLYREVKDYMAKNPESVYSNCRLNCEYGALDVDYQLRMADKHVCVIELDSPTIKPTKYKLTVNYNNGIEESNNGLLAKQIYMLISRMRIIKNTNNKTR